MLTSTTHVTRLGGLGSRALQLQSALARGAAVASRAQRQIPAKAVRHMSTRTKPAHLQCQFAARRFSSTTASASESSTPTLDWNKFFTLRKTRRRYQLGCSVATMVAGGSVAGLVLINIDMEWLGKIPLDPFITLGLMTMSSAALGWLAGPSIGSAFFYMAKRGVKTPMAIKEAEFFTRIKKNRVDPSVSSVGNPGKLIMNPPLRLGIVACMRLTRDFRNSSGLLRREDFKCCRIQAVAQGPKSLQQEADQLCLDVTLRCCVSEQMADEERTVLPWRNAMWHVPPPVPRATTC